MGILPYPAAREETMPQKFLVTAIGLAVVAWIAIATLENQVEGGLVPVRDNMIAAFAGAFFAFLFVRLGDSFERVRQRKVLGFNTLVAVERRLSMSLSEIGDNQQVVANFVTRMSEPLDGGAAKLHFFSLPGIVTFPEGRTTDLTNLVVLNDLLSWTIHVRKTNSSLGVLGDSYSRLRERYLAGDIDPAAYGSNVSDIVSLCRPLQRHLDMFFEETCDLLAKVRAFRKSQENSVVEVAVGLPRDFDNLVQSEKHALTGEIANTRSQSQQRIDAIYEQ